MIKKLITSRIFSFILGAILFSGVTVFAYSISSKDIAFTPSNPEWQVTNVEEAMNSLYDKSVIKTGELFLKFYGQVDNNKVHQSASNWAYQNYNNLDFSDIKSFKFNLEYTSDYPMGEILNISDETKRLLSITSKNSINNSYEVETNGNSNINILLGIPQVGTLKLKITSYTKMNGTVVSF